MNKRNKREDKFCALYYPFSRCLREVDLKRMLFLFDQIFFVDPLSRDLGDPPGQRPVNAASLSSMMLRANLDSGRDSQKSGRE